MTFLVKLNLEMYTCFIFVITTVSLILKLFFYERIICFRLFFYFFAQIYFSLFDHREIDSFSLLSLNKSAKTVHRNAYSIFKIFFLVVLKIGSSLLLLSHVDNKHDFIFYLMIFHNY